MGGLCKKKKSERERERELERERVRRMRIGGEKRVLKREAVGVLRAYR